MVPEPTARSGANELIADSSLVNVTRQTFPSATIDERETDAYSDLFAAT
jgi:hypothetical protein